MFNFSSYNKRYLNRWLYVVIAILCCIGPVLLYLAGESGMMKRQLLGFIAGIVILCFVSLVDYHFLSKVVVLLYLGVTGLLFLIRFTPLGEDHTTGAYRWLSLGPVDLQVSELAKIVLILTLAVFLNRHRNEMNKWSVFLRAVLITLVPTSLILIQTDLSSSVVMLFICVVMLFAAGLSYKIMGTVVAIGLPVTVGLVWYVQQPYQLLLTMKQQERVLGFFHQEQYAATYMFQQVNSVRAIASGGIAGKLLSQGTAGRLYGKVYVNESDFIFSIIGEEFGFLGSCLILGLLLFVVYQCLKTARKSRDFLGNMMAMGISAMFMFQVFANIGVATSILPNTGLPLPFLSYGLSSLLSSLIAIGIVENIGLQRKR